MISLHRHIVHIILVFIFTTMILSLFLNRIYRFNQIEKSILEEKNRLADILRKSKLKELQKTIFLNLDRPPDHTYNINVTRSESISLERDIPDTRLRNCRRLYDLDALPTVTVIIPFYNEALSMLLRTVHSILNRTPKKLLREIILVNDHSPNKDLGLPLERYLKYLPRKVHLIRMKKREGLIRARLIGAKMATGDVLMFQDAHTEANVQWAEPLLFEILQNPRTVIQPNTDQIEANTIEYLGNNAGTVPRGGFTWDLRYVWMEMPDHELQRTKKRHLFEPHRTPTLVGCAIAIRKDFFFSIGAFDDDMKIWGAENVELGFRAWMCGGQVLNHPCSRVAHTFKPFAYSFDGSREKIVQKNQMRLALLWMDDWAKFFLASTYSWPTKYVSFDKSEKQSLHNRQVMKRNLNCKGFKWFLDNIIPEVPTPPMDAVFYGEVFNLKSELCLYVTSKGFVGLTNFCFFHRVLPNNIFYIDTGRRLIYRHRCVAVHIETMFLQIADCPELIGDANRQFWDVKRHSEVEGMIFVKMIKDNKEQTFCLTQITNVLKIHYMKQMPQLLPCKDDDQFQKWRWTYKFDFSYDWDHFNSTVD